MKPIIGANHRATRITITLPVDEDGEPAFDENGKPVKGVTPVTLTVPRFDCIPRAQFKQLVKDLDAVDEMKDDDGTPLLPQDRTFEVVLAMLRPFTTDDELKLVSNLTLFEVEQIGQQVRDGSSITLPELLASTGSSKSSARPSNTTSSELDFESETSATS
jgi:hypothetical protein